MQKFHFVTFFCGLVVCCLAIIACADDELAGNTQVSGVPIVFATGIQNEENAAMSNSRASRASEVPLMHEFVLYGYKGVSPKIVFNGYTLTYHPNSAGTSEENSHDYSYVDPLINQYIKFWDFGASEYNFWGYTGDKAHFQADGGGHRDGTSLTIPDLTLSITEPDVSQKLFSKLYHRSPVSSEVVRLQFMRPYAKVRLLFYTSEEQTGADQIALADITFGGGPGSITSSGTMTVNYPKAGGTGETITVTAGTSPGSTQDVLGFDNIILDATHGTASNNSVIAVPNGGTEWYYALPLSTAATPVAFTLSLNIDGDPKTTVVPAAYMHWHPNTCYTYIFKITEAGKKIEFYDVKVDPWQYGGSQDDEWKNW